MPQSEISIENYRDFERYLSVLSRGARGRRAWRPIANSINEVLRPVRAAIRAATPVRTGTLRRTTRIRGFPPRPDKYARNSVYTNAYVGWISPRAGGGRTTFVKSFLEGRDSIIATAWDKNLRSIEQNITVAMERRFRELALQTGARFPRLRVR